MRIELEELTIRALWERSVRLFGNLPAIGAVGEQPWTFRQVNEAVTRFTNELREAGLRPGDRLAVLGDNCPHWVVTYLAATTTGITLVPILTGFPEADVRHILRHAEVTAVVVDSRQRAKVEEMDETARPLLISMETLELIGPRDEPGFFRKALERIRKGFSRSRDGEEGPVPADIAAIIYTSGTTGHSKGVILTQRNISFDAIHSIERFPIDERDRFLSILPLAHTYEATGGMLCPLTAGSSVIYLKGLPTPQKLLDGMSEVKPTAVLSVPLVMEKIYRSRVLPTVQKSPLLRQLYKTRFFRQKIHRKAGKKLLAAFGGRLRFFMFGGAGLAPEVERFLADAGIDFATGYGLTEASPIVAISPVGHGKLGSCGRAIPGIEVAILSPDPRSGIGEIGVRGATVMSGYYRNPEITAEVLRADGFLRTGDLGTIDEEGFIYIKGRSKNVIIGPSGENIYPEAVEQVLSSIPLIQEAVVFAREGKLEALVYLDYDRLDHDFPTKGGGDEPPLPLAEVLEQARREVNEKLPSFSRIARLHEHREPFEKTPTNKVKRYLYVPPLA